VVPVRETYSAPVDAYKLVLGFAGYGDFRSSELLRLPTQTFGMKLKCKSNVSSLG